MMNISAEELVPLIVSMPPWVTRYCRSAIGSDIAVQICRYRSIAEAIVKKKKRLRFCCVAMPYLFLVTVVALAVAFYGQPRIFVGMTLLALVVSISAWLSCQFRLGGTEDRIFLNDGAERFVAYLQSLRRHPDIWGVASEEHLGDGSLQVLRGLTKQLPRRP